MDGFNLRMVGSRMLKGDMINGIYCLYDQRKYIIYSKRVPVSFLSKDTLLVNSFSVYIHS